jgi:hypothetical protein
MGRFLLFLIIVVAALAGVWFYAPGGKDMLMGVKDKAMGYMPGGADDAAADDAAVADDSAAGDMAADDAAADDMAADEGAGDEAAADAPQR